MERYQYLHGSISAKQCDITRTASSAAVLTIADEKWACLIDSTGNRKHQRRELGVVVAMGGLPFLRGNSGGVNAVFQMCGSTSRN
ncbi:hypothetical protein TNCV_1037241 [Trichonephila clavipes]|nr:hypothetical protein TNCV_1037241 [Trichonephila clavipes]